MAQNLTDQLSQLANTFADGVRRLLSPVPQSVRDELGDEAAQFAELFANANPDAEYTSLMIAIPIAQETAVQLAIEGGEPPEAMHITLAYMGDTAVLSDEEIAGAVLAACRVAASSAPLIGKVGGVGRFNASPTSDGMDVIYAVVDVPGLEKLRQSLVDCLGWYGVPVSQSHGFNPHITLAYVAPGTTGPDALPALSLRLDRLMIALNGQWVERPLAGHINYDTQPPHIYDEMSELCAKSTEVDDGRTRLFFPVRFAELPATINYRPIPGVYDHAEYGKVVVSKESNERLVANFNNGVYQKEIPIDAEHQTKLSGAVAWIKRMVMRDDGSVDAEVSWTDRGKKLLKSGQFKYFSPEWYNNWCDPGTEACYQDVAVGGAITTRPFFKEKYLRPLISSEMTAVDVDTPAPAGTAVSDDSVNPAGGDASGAASANIHKENGMSEKDPIQDPATQPATVAPEAFAEVQTQLRAMQESLAAVTGELKSATEARTQAEAQATALLQANETMAEQLKQAAERVTAIERKARNQRFAEMVDGGQSGRLWFGEPVGHVSMLETLADTFGEESDQFKAYVQQQQSVAEAMAMSELFKEKGTTRSGVASAEQRLDAETKKYMESNPGVTYAQAYTAVMESDPTLYEQYLKEDQAR